MSARFPIPAAALEHHVAILGKTGSGKSYAAQGIVERLIEQRQRVCVIDPTDRYWGLRLLADGRHPSGYDVVIFGGQKADLPLSASHGGSIAEIVGTTATPVIISTRLMTVGERTKFFIGFAETLLRKNQGPLHLVVDEAHIFAPQTKVTSVQSGELLHATNNLVSLGRGIGLRIMLLTQRPAKLHKDSLTQVETLVAMRLIAPQDRAAIKEWVKEWADEATGAEMIASLPSLPTGEAWVWAPELDVLRKGRFPEISTYDSGKAPVANRKGPELKPIDLAAVRGKLEVVAKEAIENDPKELKKKIAELERQIRARPAETKTVERTVVDEKAIERAATRAKMEGYADAMKGVHEQMAGLREKIAPLEQAIGAVKADLAMIEKWAARELKKPTGVAPVTHDIVIPSGSPAPTKPDSSAPAPRRQPPSPAASGDGSLSGSDLQLLRALAYWHALGFAAPSRVQAAAVAGWRVTSGHLKNIAGSLKTRGLIWYPNSGTMALTEEGKAVAPPADTSINVHDTIRSILDGSQRQAFEFLLGARDRQATREELAQGCGWSPTSGHIKNVLGSMRSMQVVDYPGSGVVSISEWVPR